MTPVITDAVVVRPAARLRGSPALPGDKSVSHRALLLALLAHGESLIVAAGDGADVRSTARVIAALGATVERVAETGGRVDYRVTSPGGAALAEPEAVLDCGNSGTTTRLVAGLLAGRPLFAVLDGDASLRRRPMGRVVEPLRAMGAVFAGRRGDTLLPLAITGRGSLSLIDYRTSVPSAQVEVRHPAGRSRGGGRDPRDRGRRDPGRHRADAPRPRRARARGDRAGRDPRRGASRPGGRGRRRRDRPRGLVGRVVLAGGRLDPPGCGAAPRRGEHEPHAACHHRHPQAHGRPHRGARPPGPRRPGRRAPLGPRGPVERPSGHRRLTRRGGGGDRRDPDPRPGRDRGVRNHPYPGLPGSSGTRSRTASPGSRPAWTHSARTFVSRATISRSAVARASRERSPRAWTITGWR